MKMLDELKISPTPWKLGGLVTIDGVKATPCDANGEDVVKWKPYNPETRVANSQLIAMAPELYKCLMEAYLNMTDKYPYKHSFKGDEAVRWKRVLDMASGESEADDGI